MLLTRRSLLSDIIHEREIDAPEKTVLDWLSRKEKGDETNPHIQDAFPHLSADDREYILSGITPEEWALI